MQGGAIWGSRSTWRRRVPPVVQPMPTHDMHVCVKKITTEAAVQNNVHSGKLKANGEEKKKKPKTIESQA